MKDNGYIILGIMWIVLWVVESILMVGQTYEGGIYPNYLPFYMLFMLMFPFVMGYLGGKLQNEH